MAEFKKTEKVLNNMSTADVKEAPKARELSDASMSVRKKQETPKASDVKPAKIKFQVLFNNGKACNICSESSEKIAKYITENAHEIEKITRI